MYGLIASAPKPVMRHMWCTSRGSPDSDTCKRPTSRHNLSDCIRCRAEARAGDSRRTQSSATEQGGERQERGRIEAHEANAGAEKVFDEVVVHSADGHERRDVAASRADRAVGQDDERKAGLDRLPTPSTSATAHRSLRKEVALGASDRENETRERDASEQEEEERADLGGL
eukprot:3572303-Rhodomonas_salina.2